MTVAVRYRKTMVICSLARALKGQHPRASKGHSKGHKGTQRALKGQVSVPFAMWAMLDGGVCG